MSQLVNQSVNDDSVCRAALGFARVCLIPHMNKTNMQWLDTDALTFTEPREVQWSPFFGI